MATHTPPSIAPALLWWVVEEAAHADEDYVSADQLLAAAREHGVHFSQDVAPRTAVLAMYRYHRTLAKGEGYDPWSSDPDLYAVPPANLTYAETCLEQVGNSMTSEEGADQATVASAHALVVLTRCVERIESHLSLIAQKVAGGSVPIPPGAKQTLTPIRIDPQSR